MPLPIVLAVAFYTWVVVENVNAQNERDEKAEQARLQKEKDDAEEAERQRQITQKFAERKTQLESILETEKATLVTTIDTYNSYSLSAQDEGCPEIKKEASAALREKQSTGSALSTAVGTHGAIKNVINGLKNHIAQEEVDIALQDDVINTLDAPEKIEEELAVVRKEQGEVNEEISKLEKDVKDIEEAKKPIDLAKYIASLLDEALGNSPMRRKCTLDFYLKKYRPDVEALATEKEKLIEECNSLNNELKQLTGLDEKQAELEDWINKTNKQKKAFEQKVLKREKDLDNVLALLAESQGPGKNQEQLSEEIQNLQKENNDLRKLLQGFKRNEARLSQSGEEGL